MTALYKENKINCTLKGVYPEYTNIEEPVIVQGRFINMVDVKERRKVCVIGKRIHETLFPKGDNPLWQVPEH